MQKRYQIAVIAAVSSLLAGCGGGSSNGIPKITSVNPTQTGTLQFAVGTANIYGTGAGLNVVSTYRQTGGISNVTVNTPTIVGPLTLPAAGAAGSFQINPNTGASVDPYSTLPSGPSMEEVAVGNAIGGTSQQLHPGTPACDQTTPCVVPNNQTGGTATVNPNTSTFGEGGGVFTNGLSPGNYTQQGVPISFVPYMEPLYDTSTNAFEPFGGPPAFDPDHNGMGLRDGLNNLGSGVLGIPMGMTTFAGVGARAGQYTLSVQVPTTGSPLGTSKMASLTSTALLPAITAPTFVPDTSGGGTFAVAALPPGVTEELVQIQDIGPGSSLTNCQGPLGATGGAGPVYYAIIVKAPGTYTLPDTDGPNTNTTGGAAGLSPSPSICTGTQNTAANGGTTTPPDMYTVQAVGVDYPLYESLFPMNTTQTPTIVGANGQADITISSLGGPNVGAASRLRRMQTMQLHRHVLH